MEWKKEYDRVKKRFALFPIAIDDTVKWLETVYIVQHRRVWAWGEESSWYNVRFIDKKEYEEWKKGDSDA